MLIYTIFGIIESLTEFKVLQIGGLLGFVYVSWAIGRFFDKKKKINYLKGFLSYILGMLTFTLAAIALGTTIDFLIN
jgi:predicted tellurium resistance membrane protein TerC